MPRKKKVMDAFTRTGSFAEIVVGCEGDTLDLFGPTIQFLLAPQPGDEAPCVIKGTIPPGVSVPIHSHADVEGFFVLSGKVEVFSDKGGKAHWITASPGDFVKVPGNAKHGFRNQSPAAVVQLITTTSKLGRFFQEVGRSLSRDAKLGPPSTQEIQQFLKATERYGYWLASPEENASAGISLF
jgi:quercetin dioxygenase-like cupin family protein